MHHEQTTENYLPPGITDKTNFNEFIAGDQRRLQSQSPGLGFS